MGLPVLEHELESHLHDAWIRGVQEFAERRAKKVIIGTVECRYDSLKGRCTVISVIRHVEGFGAKLQRFFLLDGK